MSEENNNDEIDASKIHFLNPKDIKIEVRQLALQNIIDRLENDEILFFTGYQRNANLWTAEQQSLLIESILLQLPLAVFCFDVADDAKWAVVDGVQRLSAISNFIFKGLKLVKVEYLKEIQGKSFDELPREMQRRIREFNITAYLINKENPPEVKFNLWKRLNGFVFDTEKNKNALLTDATANFLQTLAANKTFKIATNDKISSFKLLDSDFINRFLAFYLVGEEKYKNDISSFMNNALKILEKMPEKERVDIRLSFEQAMKTAYDIFGNYAFRKRYSLDEKTEKRRLNRAIFEVLSVSFARLSAIEAQILIERKDIFQQYFVEECNTPAFEDSIARATGDKRNVLYRYATIKKIIESTLNNNQSND